MKVTEFPEEARNLFVIYPFYEFSLNNAELPGVGPKKCNDWGYPRLILTA